MIQHLSGPLGTMDESGAAGSDRPGDSKPMQSEPDLLRHSPRALHEQLTDRLRAELASSYRAGDRIPTEGEIMQAHRLSRVTVRRALQTLVDDGVLVRRQGKGTFLASQRPRVVHRIDRFGPFLDAFTASGVEVQVTLLDFRWEGPGALPDVLRAGQRKALVYDRLYATDGFAHGLNRITLPGEFGEAVTTRHAETMGIYQILREVLGIVPQRAEFELISELPGTALARALRISPSTPLLVLDRISFDASGRAVERTRHHLLPEVYRLAFGLAPGPG
ncbi:MAG TPA: GntR family transcriptional regulator [Acetobacteraceae bacterium]|nr:GntR family transcriptional regulator [Acetobacteraceae bacterium]